MRRRVQLTHSETGIIISKRITLPILTNARYVITTCKLVEMHACTIQHITSIAHAHVRSKTCI